MGDEALFVVGIRKIAVGKKYRSNAKFPDTVPKVLLHYYSTGIMEQRYL